jgi:hypothetical protein
MGDDWKYIVEEILFSIKYYNLHKLTQLINISILGKEDQRFYIKSILDNYFSNYKIIFESEDLSHYEFPTLIELQRQSSQKCKIWYVHSKGVSKPRDYNMDMWRRLMIWGVIESANNCVDLLNTYNAVGVLKDHYSENKHIYHGNWWWANSDYIKSLPCIENLKNNPNSVAHPNYMSENLRLQCEYWVYFYNTDKCHVLIPGDRKTWNLYLNLKHVKTIKDYCLKDYVVIKNVNPLLLNFNKDNLDLYYSYLSNKNKGCILDTMDGDGIVDYKNLIKEKKEYKIPNNYAQIVDELNLKGEKYFYENF